MYTHKPVLPLGECQMTPGARDAAEEVQISLPRLLTRHAGGDWGDLSREDWNLNDAALKEGNRILSSYKFSNAVTFWIITEGDRSATTVMLPDEY